MRVKYRVYDDALNTASEQLLEDADEYFPDLVKTCEGLEGPQVFITSWLLYPQVALNRDKVTLTAFLQDILARPGGRVFLLWNTYFNGTPYPKLREEAQKFHDAVTGSEAEAKLRFKIILSTVRDHAYWYLEWPADQGIWLYRNYWAEDPEGIPESIGDLWTNSDFQNGGVGYGNLAQFTIGSHHQKTFTVVGSRSDADSGDTVEIHSYCGGIDFSMGPSGYHASRRTFNGGTWWYDTAGRVEGDHAEGVLANFCERWNKDLQGVRDGEVLAYGFDDGVHDDLNTTDFYTRQSWTPGLLDDVQTYRTIPLGGVDVPIFGDTRRTEIRDTYLSWIGSATERIILANQYFRHLDIGDAIFDRLSAVPDLRVTIVKPSFVYELQSVQKFVRTRYDYSRPGVDEATKNRLFADAERHSLEVDPGSKLGLYLMCRFLERLVSHPRVRIWIPERRSGGKIFGNPYIHAKHAVVDDQLMVGSANINPRSLDGFTDSEINLALTEAAVVQRIVQERRWAEEPDDENDPAYAGSWYEQQRLVRYTQAYWEIDQEYGSFPRGRVELKNWVQGLKNNATIKQLGLKGILTMTDTVIDNSPDIALDQDFGWTLYRLIGFLV